MKRSVCSLLTLLAGATVSYAQGTVNFANYGVLNQYIYVSVSGLSGGSSYIGGSGAGPAPNLSNWASEIQNGNDWTVALYGEVGANNPSYYLNWLGVSATFANGQVDSVPGTWYSSEIATVPGAAFAGIVATVELVVWYNAGGAVTSLGQAFATGVPVGFSQTANVMLGGPEADGPPAFPATLPPSLGSFQIGFVPEPGTMILAVCGAAVFFCGRRRE